MLRKNPLPAALALALALGLAGQGLAADFEITDELIQTLGKEQLARVRKHLKRPTEGKVRFRLVDVDTLQKTLEAELQVQLLTQLGDEDAARSEAKTYSTMMAPTLLGKYATEGSEIMICAQNFRTLARTLALPKLNSAEVLKAILIHESVHAVSDEIYGWSEVLEKIEKRETVMAYNAVFEGHAQHVTRALCEGTEIEEAFDLYTSSVGRLDPDLPQAIEFLARIMASETVAAYIEGEKFVSAILLEGGEPALRKAYEHPPRDLDEIVRPEWYLDPSKRKKLEYDLDAAMDEFASDYESDEWSVTRLAMTIPQMRAALALLDAKEVDRVVGAIQHNRGAVVADSATGQDKMIVAVVYECASVEDALYYLAVVERLSKLKDEKMKTGPLRITASSSEEVRAETWQGLYQKKEVTAGFTKIPASSLIAVNGRIVVELAYSNVGDIEKRTLKEVATRLLAKATQKL